MLLGNLFIEFMIFGITSCVLIVKEVFKPPVDVA